VKKVLLAVRTDILFLKSLSHDDIEIVGSVLSYEEMINFLLLQPAPDVILLHEGLCCEDRLIIPPDKILHLRKISPKCKIVLVGHSDIPVKFENDKIGFYKRNNINYLGGSFSKQELLNAVLAKNG
jgi:hypothetical protein